MIDITTALYNILHSRYGRDVRQSIHDGIYQINENANEAVQTAKAMGVGTAVDSSTSSSTGYVKGNLYLNNSTWDLWQCVGTNSWVNKGNVKGAKGDEGDSGASNYIHVRYSENYDGTDFTPSPTGSSKYIGIYNGESETAPTNKADYKWTAYVGASGTSAYVHIMYSENADGTDFVSIPTPNCKYIGIYSGTSSSAPANKSYYTWSEYVGKSGAGTGDMLKSEFAGSGIAGTVDKALNLRTSNGIDVSADAITTKLSKLDNNGQLDFEDVKNTPKTLEGYGITDTYTKADVDDKVDEWHKYGGAVEVQTVNTIDTDVQITFHGINNSLAYKLFFDTSDGKQTKLIDSSLVGTDITYTVNTPTLGTQFKLRVIK